MTLDSEIQIAFSATQIILVFLSVLFGIRYQQINNLLSEDHFDIDNLKSLEKRLHHNLIYICGVMLIINIIISLIFLPIFIQVVISALSYITTKITYNFTQTSYFIITLMIFGLTYWSYLLTKKVYYRKNEIHNKIEKREN